ncbi:gamma-glutamylcyclotransferase [Jannaschia formosa]|uniref:gamma-glutamylcyclotransferase n=1 Tax=Jannaschia formosa TaxID=2259592 RepID=UPI000E1BE353|nr:gamma-glutamylcyclotransferase [Jannaschia formosa]TFL20034.1 gamma-glutamylcyclotransferase [Jannaschia formosa]
MDAPDELWVFGYGSLIFDPGIEVAETRLATLAGFRRRFCMWSIHHRGSEAEPGLVLALEPFEGEACTGLAIRAEEPERALASLRARELISSAYREEDVTLLCKDGSEIAAIAYVVDTAHRQYTGALPLERQAKIIAHAAGGRGPNHEYLTKTAEKLHALGIGDPDIDWLVSRVQQMRADG